MSLSWPDTDGDFDKRILMGLSELGWEEAVTSHCPLLSHSQLSRRLEGRPSDLFSAMAGGLGLEQIEDAHDHIRKQKRADDRVSREARDALDALLPDLRALDDERATACGGALASEPWNLGDVEAVLAGELDGEGEQPLDILRGLVALRAPTAEEIDDVRSELAEAQERLKAIAGSDAERAERLLKALSEALAVHEHDGEQPCPVCGKGTIDAVWATETRDRMAELRRQAEEASEAHKARSGAIKKARQLCVSAPAVLERAEQVGIDASAVASAWRDWAAALDGEPPLLDLAERLDGRGAALQEVVRALGETARAEIEHRHSLWLPLRQRLVEWLSQGRAAQEAEARRAVLRAAEKWVKEVQGDVRAERFKPISERAQRFWEMMRQNSSVSLEEIALAGVGNRQHLDLSVSVDGVESAALGVMSQGELNTLSLSLFLARATLDESPFRFLVIDDPVQAMDPAKVEGLATVLQEVALGRQVVVFTHDTRLRHTVRQMGVDVHVFEVMRDPNSRVVCRKDDGPVRQNLDYARAVLRTEQASDATKRRVVPVFCRQALEAACLEGVWRRRTAGGTDPEQTETDVREALSLDDKLALFLFDDAGRAGDALGAVKATFGGKAEEVVTDCNSGSHDGPLSMQPGELINATRRLVDKLRKWK